MMLIINSCAEKLHYFEFVKPIEDIIRKNNIKYVSRHYSEIKKADLEKATKIIICGTSLKDDHFLKDIKNFSWIKQTDKPILGICAGMQIIGLLFNGKLNKKTEIGYYNERFKNFLGLKNREQVYHLHKNYVLFNKKFEIFSKGKIPQAVKHRKKEIYGVLFHPEVRQKELIRNFCFL